MFIYNNTISFGTLTIFTYVYRLFIITAFMKNHHIDIPNSTFLFSFITLLADKESNFSNNKIFLLGAWLEFQNLYYLKQYRYVIHWRNISWWSQMKMMIVKNDCSLHNNENRYIQFCFDTIFFSCAVIKYPLNIRYISIHYQVFVKWIVQKYILLSGNVL